MYNIDWHIFISALWEDMLPGVVTCMPGRLVYVSHMVTKGHSCVILDVFPQQRSCDALITNLQISNERCSFTLDDRSSQTPTLLQENKSAPVRPNGQRIS